MTASDASIAARALASGTRQRVHGQQVIDEQLQPSLTLLLVHFQPVHELHVALRWGERRAVGKVIEGDGIEAAPAAR